jgi:hypothetical protein
MKDPQITKNNAQDLISELIKKALEDGEVAPARLYESPDHYRKATGKRFRMSPDQKRRGLTREEAFNEFLNNLSTP